MTTMASQTYLTTRVAILSRRLLSEEALTEMLQRPLKQLARTYNLGELIHASTTAAGLNRAVERAFIQTLMRELSVLLRPLQGPARGVLVHWIRKFELYNLKALIRGKLHGHPDQEIEDNLYELPALISLPHKRLLRSEQVAELLRQLEQGHYSDIARQARRVYEEKNEPFSLDATIDQRYYTGLLKRARATEGVDHAPLLALVRVLIDQHNLEWLLRYRFNYALSASATYYLLIPFGRYLQRDRLKVLVNLDSPPAVIAALPEPLAKTLDGTADIASISYALSRVTMAPQATKSLKFSHSATCRSLAYLVLRELDLKRVLAVIQGKILKLDEALVGEAAGVRKARHV